METMLAVQARKSCRNYLDRAVDEAQLVMVLEAGKRAPNAGPLQITVVRDSNYLKNIDAATLEAMKSSGNAFLMERASLPGYRPLYGAPTLILLSGEPGGYSEVNAACAATAMTLAAADLGLGSCFVVSPKLALNGRNPLSARLGLPAGYAPMCGVLLGHAGEHAFAAPRSDAIQVNYV